MPTVHKPLTIALGTKLKSGPFGGGTKFAAALTAYLTSQGHRVVTDLNQPNIDVILITEPRPWSSSGNFDTVRALSYRSRYPGTRIIHRINECDERKGNRLRLHNHLLYLTARQADAVVFVSAWLKQLHYQQNQNGWPKTTAVIHNGADSTIFKRSTTIPWNGSSPLKIVTHHWSNNWNKGWDIYQRLDQLLAGPLGQKVLFTYLGTPREDVPLKNSRVLAPLTGRHLAVELASHHLYITGSRYEPGPMHIAEALQVGLPILYRASCSLPEYSSSYGVPLKTPADLLESLKKIMSNYPRYFTATQSYNYSAVQMCQSYENLLYQVLAQPQRPAPKTTDTIKVRAVQGALWLRNSLS